MALHSVRIIIIDDHPLWRCGICAMFQGRYPFQIVAQTGCCREGIRLIGQLKPDLVLLDLNLPDMTGLEALMLLKEISPGTRVAIVSASDDAEVARAAFEGGACGYILKDSSEEQFLQAVQSILADRFWCSPQIAGMALIQISQGGSLPRLTQRERSILYAMARGLSNAEIAECLNLSKYTVQNYVSTIYQKLGVSDRWKVIELARRVAGGMTLQTATGNSKDW